MLRRRTLTPGLTGGMLLLLLLPTAGAAQDRALAGHETLQRRIDRAIDAGVQYLLDGQLIDGSWEYRRGRYPAGMTALGVYTLLKSGVSARHCAVRQGLEYLRAHPTSKTYSAGCLLMALEATRDPGLLPWMRKVSSDLVDWQLRENGIWWYSGGNRTEVARPQGEPPLDRGPPGLRDRRGGRPGLLRTPGDLSNTQYAALGLRAAHLAGIRIPTSVFRRLADGTIAHQEALRQNAGRGPTTGAGARPGAAGFRYRQKRELCTGSMTTAGIAILAICEQILGARASAAERSRMQTSRLAGMSWMIENYSIRTNPGKGNWLYYYLYGLERVGALLETEQIGEHEWYWEGARLLVDRQHPSGAWSQRRSAEGDQTECDTCFALLFLSRATATVTGGASRAMPKIYSSSSRDGMVVLHGTGDSPLSLWVSLGAGDTGRGNASRIYDLAFVDYQARAAGTSGWTSIHKALISPTASGAEAERGATRHEFEHCGHYSIRAYVGLRPSARAPAETVPRTETTPPIEVSIDELEDPERIAYGSDSERNLLPAAEPSVTVSSGSSAEALIDNDPTTSWRSARGAAAPDIKIELGRRTSAQRILFTHAFNRGRDRDRKDRPHQVTVFVNGDSKPIVQAIDPDPRTKTVLELPHRRTVRRLRILIDGGDARGSGKHPIGFAEIELQK